MDVAAGSPGSSVDYGYRIAAHGRCARRYGYGAPAESEGAVHDRLQRERDHPRGRLDIEIPLLPKPFTVEALARKVSGIATPEKAMPVTSSKLTPWGAGEGDTSCVAWRLIEKTSTELKTSLGRTFFARRCLSATNFGFGDRWALETRY
jgi:hypothetical protein